MIYSKIQSLTQTPASDVGGFVAEINMASKVATRPM
jgi:hypothetical protein